MVRGIGLHAGEIRPHLRKVFQQYDAKQRSGAAARKESSSNAMLLAAQ
jgi:hypothetical protein